MDTPDLDAVLRTVRRSLRIGGWLGFSLTHPCIQVRFSGWVT
jgi:hypothetical protein